MPENNSERFKEMIRSANIFLSIFDLTILYDENDDIPYCSLMAISDGKGNVVGQLTGPAYDRETRRRFYSIEASTEAFPKIEAQILSSKKKVSNEYCFIDRGVHYYYEVNYDVITNNVIANHLSGGFTISDPIKDIDPRETVVEREIEFNLKASQKPNELFSISSKNAKTTIKEEVYEENRYTGNRTIKMEYADGEIVLSIRKDGNSSLRYVNVNGECRATVMVLDANTEPYMEVYCVEKNVLNNASEEETAKYYAWKLEKILEGKSFDRPFDKNKITVNNISIEDDGRGNIMQLFNAVNTYATKIDMHEIPSKATTVMDYLGSDDCAPIHVFYSLMSVAFGFLNDEELTSLVGLNPRKLPDTPTVDSKTGIVILPQNKMFGIVKE